MIPIQRPTKTGYIQSKGHAIYYEVYGDLSSGNTPLLVAHGGPGSSHNMLLPLSSLSNERPVILYDQLGSGRSQFPESDRFYNIDYFVSELEQLYRQLRLRRIHLFGHSWGGMMVTEYLKRPRKHVQTVILASSMIDSKLHTQDALKLAAKIDKNYPAIVSKHLRAGTTGSQEFEALDKAYIRKHIFRNDERDEQFRSYNKNLHLYQKMWGPTEIAITGTLKNWSGLRILPTITQPTLVISGQYDELTPAQNQQTVKLLPNGTSSIIPGASHLGFLEKTGLYLKAVKEFLDAHDS